MSRIEELKRTYEAAGQGHVLKDYESMDFRDQDRLAAQLGEVDPAASYDMFRQAIGKDAAAGCGASFLTPPLLTKYDGNPQIPEWREAGLKLIGEGKVAACILAGGAGTRLHTATVPNKGLLEINLPTQYTIFQIQALKLKRLQNLACQLTNNMASIPLIVLTNTASHDDVVNHFRANGFFGLNGNDCHFLKQGTMPVFTPEGKLLMRDPHHLQLAPDGNAGIYPAMARSGVMEELKQRGIEYLFLSPADNPLAKPVDPIQLGQMVADGLEVSTKSVLREGTDTAMMVVQTGGGSLELHPALELGQALVKKEGGEGGGFYLDDTSAGAHLLTLKFLFRVLEEHRASLSGRFHASEKTFRTASGEEKGMVLECYLSDAFRYASKVGVARVIRDEEFSPIKNPDGFGFESPTTARRAVFELHKRWLEKAGVKLEQDTEVDQEGRCHICPMVSFNGEGLAELKGNSMKMPVELRCE